MEDRFSKTPIASSPVPDPAPVREPGYWSPWIAVAVVDLIASSWTLCMLIWFLATEFGRFPRRTNSDYTALFCVGASGLLFVAGILKLVNAKPFPQMLVLAFGLAFGSGAWCLSLLDFVEGNWILRWYLASVYCVWVAVQFAVTIFIMVASRRERNEEARIE